MQPKAGPSAAVIHRWLTHAETVLTDHRRELNAINVFPVQDSDTGSNLVQTITAAVAGLPAPPQPVRHVGEDRETPGPVDLGAILGAAGAQALEHARGNSGTILAVMLSAMAEPLAGYARLTPPALAAALERASVRCWSALSDPVPGTMLSVIEAAATTCAVQAVDRDGDESHLGLVAVLDAVIGAAAAAVAATEEQNDVLARARVVDAGAVGLLLILQCLRWAVTGDPVAVEPLQRLDGMDHGEHPDAMDGVEIMCSINLSPLDAASLRITLDELGESVILTAITPVGQTASDAETCDESRGSGDAASGAEVPGAAYRWRLHAHVPHEVHDRALAAISGSGAPENLLVTPLRAEETPEPNQ
ncbi:DAK2 domain-containing protein [Tersicoccus phoenicis]|uniref:DAK2 domain-containing protein n=1 Tax=Tersicoccus phoenicis TaxID=554083 RepID=UPI001F3C8309|nr:DAK2 domain-containing protein [Tersicoccus phoenicis]